MDRLIYLKDAVTLELDAGKCSGCGLCTIVCPRGVFEMGGRKAYITIRDACIECGACARNCPSEAIHVRVGVGCASAVLNGMFGRKNAACCCSLDQYETDDGQGSKQL